MIQIPEFKQHYSIENLGKDGYAILSENQYYCLNGKALLKVMPLINGKNSVDDILIALENEVSMPEIFYALSMLETQGHIVEAKSQLPAGSRAFWHSLNVEDERVTQKLDSQSVKITIVGNLNLPFSIAALFEAAGVTVTDTEDALEVVFTDDYDHAAINEIHLQNHKTGRRWLLIKPVGTEIWLGPAFGMGDDCACWGCLQQRLRANRQMESYIIDLNKKESPVIRSKSALPSNLYVAVGLAVTEVAKILVTGNSDSLKNNLRTFNLHHLTVNNHAVIKRPQCQSCGSPQFFDPNRPPEIVVLQTSFKKAKNDGGHRSQTAEQTYEQYKHHVSPITGVVSHLERIDEYEQFDTTGAANIIFTYASGHNFAMMNSKGLFFLLKNIRGRSGGKGMTDIQAKVGGMCEAIERYSGVFRGDEPMRQATYQSLGEQAIHPSEFLLFSEYQYKNREEWNAQKSDYHIVPLPFDENRMMSWVLATCLSESSHKYIPAGYCYYGHPDIVSYFDMACDANGTAAGKGREEAILQGFLELIERDAVAIWWYNRIQREGIDIDSFDLPYIQELRRVYQKMNRELWVIDITSDLGIYTFAAICRRTDKNHEDITIGFGAHLDPKIALLRAVTEVNQFMPCVSDDPITGETLYNFNDGDAIIWWKTAKLVDHPYLSPRADIPFKTLEQYPDLSTDDMKKDVLFCVEQAKTAGMHTYVIDHTRPDIGLAVCKVIVPGMRHFWMRLGKGRLYDVPVKMGWLDKPIDESELNPIGIFF